MRNSPILTVALIAGTVISSVACPLTSPLAQGNDWLTLPSTYTHDVSSGQRVSQYAPVAAPTAPQPNNLRTSGYTHTRSTLNYGQSQDNYHRVEEWGDPVRPYGEWRFPYRPYSTPYPNWGPPFGGLGGVTGRGGVIGRGAGLRPGIAQPLPSRPPSHPGQGGQPNPYSAGAGKHSPGHWFPQQAGDPNPYPAGPGSPYQVAPYYDGSYPTYRD